MLSMVNALDTVDADFAAIEPDGRDEILAAFFDALLASDAPSPFHRALLAFGHAVACADDLPGTTMLLVDFVAVLTAFEALDAEARAALDAALCAATRDGDDLVELPASLGDAAVAVIAQGPPGPVVPAGHHPTYPDDRHARG